MARSLLSTAALLLSIGLSPAIGVVEASAAPPALPALPGPASASASPAPSTGGTADRSDPGYGGTTNNGVTLEQVRRGVVQIEQAGRPLGVGAVLARDGRVLTALSTLANVPDPEIRYADGTVVKAKVGHKDKDWDLALLIPLTGKWLDGLIPTDVDPQSIQVKSFLPKAGKLAPAPVGVKGRVDAKSKEGETLRGALEMDLKGGTAAFGAPLIDPDGRVVGLLVRACKDGAAPSSVTPQSAPCSALTIGVPVYALRGFLQKTPANAVQPAPWLGLGGAPSVNGNVKGVKVMGVAPGSPAEKGGLKTGDGGDTIVAVDGQPVETPEQLAEVIGKRSIGQQVKLLLFSSGKFREVAVTLRSAP